MSKWIPKPATEIPIKVTIETPLLSEISVQRLIDESLLILYREVHNLKLLSVKGKLDAAAARDLRDHTKLLFELKEREDASLKNLSDEQLEAILEERKQKNVNK